MPSGRPKTTTTTADHHHQPNRPGTLRPPSAQATAFLNSEQLPTSSSASSRRSYYTPSSAPASDLLTLREEATSPAPLDGSHSTTSFYSASQGGTIRGTTGPPSVAVAPVRHSKHHHPRPPTSTASGPVSKTQGAAGVGKSSLKPSKHSSENVDKAGRRGSFLSFMEKNKKKKLKSQDSASGKKEPVANWATFSKEQGKPSQVMVTRARENAGNTSLNSWKQFLKADDSEASQDELAKVVVMTNAEPEPWIPYQQLANTFPGHQKGDAVLQLHRSPSTTLIERFDKPLVRTSRFAGTNPPLLAESVEAHRYDHLCLFMRTLICLCPCLKTLMKESLEPPYDDDDPRRPLMVSEGGAQTDNISGYSSLGAAGRQEAEAVDLLDSDQMSIWRETHATRAAQHHRHPMEESVDTAGGRPPSYSSAPTVPQRSVTPPPPPPALLTTHHHPEVAHTSTSGYGSHVFTRSQKMEVPPPSTIQDSQASPTPPPRSVAAKANKKAKGKNKQQQQPVRYF